MQDNSKKKRKTVEDQQAGTSAQQARTSAQQAGTSAQQAGTSAQQAGTSAQQAGTSAQQAGTSAQQAGTSAQQAGTSAQQAGTSAQQAGTSAQQAGTSRAKKPNIKIKETFLECEHYGDKIWKEKTLKHSIAHLRKKKGINVISYSHVGYEVLQAMETKTKNYYICDDSDGKNMMEGVSFLGKTDIKRKKIKELIPVDLLLGGTDMPIHSEDKVPQNLSFTMEQLMRFYFLLNCICEEQEQKVHWIYMSSIEKLTPTISRYLEMEPVTVALGSGHAMNIWSNGDELPRKSFSLVYKGNENEVYHKLLTYFLGGKVKD